MTYYNAYYKYCIIMTYYYNGIFYSYFKNGIFYNNVTIIVSIMFFTDPKFKLIYFVSLFLCFNSSIFFIQFLFFFHYFILVGLYQLYIEYILRVLFFTAMKKAMFAYYTIICSIKFTYPNAGETIF